MDDVGRIVPPHYSGPGEEAIPKARAPFAYPRREPSRFTDPDETEGRRLYRARANAEAAMAMALARRISLKRNPPMTTHKTMTVQERLRARRESVYDFATQGAEWQEDALCIEAADLLGRCKEALEPFARYCDLNDRFRDDPDAVIEVPIADCIAAHDTLTQLGGRK